MIKAALNREQPKQARKAMKRQQIDWTRVAPDYIPEDDTQKGRKCVSACRNVCPGQSLACVDDEKKMTD